MLSHCYPFLISFNFSLYLHWPQAAFCLVIGTLLHFFFLSFFRFDFVWLGSLFLFQAVPYLPSWEVRAHRKSSCALPDAVCLMPISPLQRSWWLRSPTDLLPGMERKKLCRAVIVLLQPGDAHIWLAELGRSGENPGGSCQQILPSLNPGPVTCEAYPAGHLGHLE